MKRITGRRHQRGQTLIIIFLGVLLLGGAGHALNQGLPGASIPTLRKQIRNVVKNPQRIDTLMTQLDDWEKRQKAHDERYANLIENMLDQFAKPQSTAADFEPLFKDADALNEEGEQRFLSSRAALRAQLGEDEWRAVFPLPDAGKKK